MLSLGARLVCGKNRKQEGSCHQLWVVGSSTSPQCFCLLEAGDELCSIGLNSSQLGPRGCLLVVKGLGEPLPFLSSGLSQQPLKLWEVVASGNLHQSWKMKPQKSLYIAGLTVWRFSFLPNSWGREQVLVLQS